jgi:predicted AlkP superfamily pyrophosphatase or phosphodiesterase
VNPPNRGAARPRDVVVALVLLLASPACTDAGEALPGGPSLMEMARALGSDVVRTLVRGYVPGRSGEIILVPKPWNVLSQWNGGYRGTGDPRTTHSTPWAYHQRVPIALYGPGYIRAGVTVDRPTSVADLAPTLAELLDTPFEARGSVLREALAPDRTDRSPRAIVVVVVDGGGWNVLERWPDAWPAERALMEGGTTFTNATVGSTPSVTAPIHATIGTGTYPSRHGITENSLRRPDGTMGDVAYDNADMRLLEAPTIADAWDRSTGNRAWVGMLGYEGWHLGMMGSGALEAGADRDVAVLWDTETEEFWTNERYYELPSYLPTRQDLDGRIEEVDGSDGALDGTWRGNTLDPSSYEFTAGPAFAAHEGEAALDVLRHEPIGQDAIPDLYFVEMKTGDIAGHVWNMESREFEAVWRTQDGAIGDLVELLDRRVGSGRYVVAITADHGQSPLPETFGGLRIDRYALRDDLELRLGGAVESVHPSDIFFQLDALEDTDIDAVARYIGGLTYGDNLPEGLEPDEVPEELLDQRVFAGALPGSFLQSLTDEEIDGLGPGLFPEGDLTTPPVLRALGQTFR